LVVLVVQVVLVALVVRLEIFLVQLPLRAVRVPPVRLVA
jgi:hypothetical protein